MTENAVWPRGVEIIHSKHGPNQVHHCGYQMAEGRVGSNDPYRYYCQQCGFKIPWFGYVPEKDLGNFYYKDESVTDSTRMTRNQARMALAAAAAALEEAEALLARHGEEPPEGSVIRFAKAFPSRQMEAFPPVEITHGMANEDEFATAMRNAQSVTMGAVFHYAAIRVNDLWYTTGPKAPKGYSWEQLLAWLDDPLPAQPIVVLANGWPGVSAQLSPPQNVERSLHRELHQLLDDYVTIKRIGRAGPELDDILTTIAAEGMDAADQRATIHGLFHRSVTGKDEPAVAGRLDEILDRYKIPPV